MKKLLKLKLCDWLLVVFTVLVLASSIQLEVTSGNGIYPVVIHIVTAMIFMVLIVWHIYLHFRWDKWLTKFRRQKVPTRILWWLYVVTFLTGVAAFVRWIVTVEHSPLGAVHGKIGFLMLIFAIWHLIRRISFLKPSKNQNRVAR